VPVWKDKLFRSVFKTGGVLLVKEKMTESQQLLAEYIENRSEAAFRRIVERYVNLVYSTALRSVSGDRHLAEDVTQIVFIHLARKAHKLGPKSMIGGWLHRDTCFVASKVLRQERRRQNREREAALMNSMPDHSTARFEEVTPLLDQAINSLGNDDRTAIVLRFFEQRDFRSVGLALGTSEDAARMRVGRALNKLQLILQGRGLALSTAALATTLGATAVAAAPAGLAASVAGTALAASNAGGLTLALLKFMTITKSNAGLAVLVAGGLAVPLFLQHRAQAKLQEQNTALQQQVAALDKRENPPVAQAPPTDDRANELLRLRGEVALLRRVTNELATLRAENQHLRASAADAAKNSGDQPPPAYATQRGRVAKILAMPLLLYASANQGRFPATLDDAERYFAKAFKLDPFMRDTAEFAEISRQFELVYQGSRDELAQSAQDRGLDPGSIILIRERQPWRSQDGTWMKSYGMANGAGQLISAGPDGTFDAFEKKYSLPVSAQEP
jgi:RNA polymerase sigma factor (sigma-70 family)